jgi:hypothetical protein
LRVGQPARGEITYVVPWSAVEYRAGQLDIADPSVVKSFGEWAKSSATKSSPPPSSTASYTTTTSSRSTAPAREEDDERDGDRPARHGVRSFTVARSGLLATADPASSASARW